MPKDRSAPEPYPAERPAGLQKAYRWLWLALLSLPLAGLGGIVFAPLAAAAAVQLYYKAPTRANGIHSLVIIVLCGSLWLVGMLLGAITLVHVR